MSNEQSALDRLYNSVNQQPQEEYSLEEQMLSADENTAEENTNFLNGMSSNSREALNKKIREVTLDTPAEPTMQSNLTESVLQQAALNESEEEIGLDMPNMTPEQPIKPQTIAPNPVQAVLSSVMSANTDNTNIDTNDTNTTDTTDIDTNDDVEESTESKVTENDSVEEPTQLHSVKETNTKTKKHPGRPRKEVTKMDNNINTNDTTVNDLFVPIMNQLAKNLIDELIKSNYKMTSFNNEQMKILFDYMYNKF